jgi:hypothetical protein
MGGKRMNKKLIIGLLLLMILSMIIVYTIPTSKRTGPTFYNVVGADTVAHMGTVRSIRNGNSPSIDQYYDNGIPRAYSWAWHWLMAVIPINVMTLLTWSPLVFWILSLLGIFYAGYLLMGKKYGILLAAFYFFIVDKSIANPNPKNLLMATALLSIAFIYKAYNSEKIWWSIAAGAMIGITFMNYSMMIALIPIPIVFFLLDIKKWRNNLIKTLVIVFVALLISMPYWLPMVSHIDASGAQAQSISSSISQYEGDPLPKRLWEVTGEFFMGNWYFIPFFMAGIYLMYLLKDSRAKIFIASYIVFFIGRFHDIPTRIFLHWQGVQPFYFPEYVYYIFYFIIIIGFLGLIDLLQEKTKKEFVGKTLVIILVLVAVVIGSLQAYQYLEVGPESWQGFIKKSYTPLEPWIANPANWINEHTGTTDVIAAHPMYAYMIFGMTGRPIYAAMYGHMLSLSDDNWRRLDAQEIYGTNSTDRALELLKKRNTSYLIVDPFIIQNQWFQTDNWEVILGIEQMPVTNNNFAKFENNTHFEPVYNYTGITIYRVHY